MLKYAPIFIFILISLAPLSITALIMSTGKFWKCPGEPFIFSWLFGFGIVGILFCWFCIVTIIERTIHRNNPDRRPVIILYVIMIILLFIFEFVWSIIGVHWVNAETIKTTDFYVNGKNLYCNPIIFKFTQATSLFTLISSVLTICIVARLLKNPHNWN